MLKAFNINNLNIYIGDLKPIHKNYNALFKDLCKFKKGELNIYEGLWERPIKIVCSP